MLPRDGDVSQIIEVQYLVCVARFGFNLII